MPLPRPALLFTALLLAACVDTESPPTDSASALDEPAFSHTSGFYDTGLRVALSHPDPTVALYYTLDGSAPDPANVAGTTYRYKLQYPLKPGDPFGPFHTQTFQSQRYKGAITISDRSGEPDRIARISTTLHDTVPYYVTPLAGLSPTQERINRLIEPLNQALTPANAPGAEAPPPAALPTFEPQPQARLLKATVLRAIAVKKGGTRSDIVSASYFVMPRDTFQLPVVSLTAQEDHLFAHENGIMVAGQAFDDFRRQHPGHVIRGGNAPANWHRRGEDTPAHLHFFSDTDKPTEASMDQRIGLRVHGGFSRANASKSLRLYARKRYGKNKFQHPVFGDDTNHKQLLLRNSGNDFQKTMFRDAAAGAILRSLNLETQGYQPTVTFLNGEYWGILNLREHHDTDYFSEKYAIAEKDIELVENNKVTEGDPSHWQQLMTFFEAADLRVEESYQQAARLIDIDSFIDHQIANIFIGNPDWPHNNVKAWRYRGTAPTYNSQGVLDGRWRWLQYDADLALTAPGANLLVGALDPRGTRNIDGVAWSTLLLRKLMDNPDFKNRFINRFADLLNTRFDPAHTTAIIQRLKDQIRPEMPRHLERWKVPTSLAEWDRHVQVMLTYAQRRPAIQRAQLMQQFGLPTDLRLSVSIPDTRQGDIRINSLHTRDLGQTGQVWTGTYFANVELALEAVAQPCHRFKHWEGLKTRPDASNARLRITPTESLQLKAVFEPNCKVAEAPPAADPKT